MLRYCAGPAYYRMCSTRHLLFKTNRLVALQNHHHHFFVSGIGQKTVDAAIVAAQKVLLKQKPSKHFVNGLLGFITLGIYTPLEAPCVLLTIIA